MQMHGPEQFDIDWIADALAKLPRWLGRARDRKSGLPLSVAQHCVWCASVLADKASPICGTSSRTATVMAGLLHDAHEAWIGDMPAPLKDQLGLDEIETELNMAVFRQVELDTGWPAGWSQAVDWRAVHAVDKAAAAVEASWFTAELRQPRLAEAALVRAHQAWLECNPLLVKLLEERILLERCPTILPYQMAADRFCRIYRDVAQDAVESDAQMCA